MLSRNFCNYVSLTKNLQRLQAYQKCLNHLLLAEINNNKKKLKVLVNELSSVKSNLLRILNFLVLIMFVILLVTTKNLSLSVSKHIKKKLRDLIPGYEESTQLDFHMALTKLFLIFLRMS